MKMLQWSSINSNLLKTKPTPQRIQVLERSIFNLQDALDLNGVFLPTHFSQDFRIINI